MEQQKIFKQMIDFQKATFDNTFNAVTMLQEQTEKMVKTYLDQAAWLPEEGQKAVSEWVNTYKKGRDDYKKAIDDHFKKVEDFFANVG